MAGDEPNRPSGESARRYQSLLARYAQLVAKHAEVAKKVEAVGVNRRSTEKLASLLGRSRQIGMALVEDGRLSGRNARFGQLDRALRRNGQWVAPSGLSPTHRQALAGLQFKRLREVVLALAERMVAGALPALVDVRLRRERGQPVLRLRLERAGAPGSASALVLALVEDVTDLAGQEQELSRARGLLARRETLRTIGEMASGVAHDLANLISALEMRTTVIRRDASLTAAQRGGLDGLLRMLRDGTGMLTRLQELSRVERERAVEPLDIAAVIREAVEMGCLAVTEGAALAGKRIEILLRLPRLPRVMGVAPELRQTFINLLLNARDAMPGGGKIIFSARRTTGGVEVKVEDDGSGIPSRLQARIFDAFFTTKGERGTGLGLWMARDLMRRIGGRISAANRAAGGATFTLEFVRARARNLPR